MQTRKAIKTKPLGRLAEITRAAPVEIDQDDRTVEISFSSETPVSRWFGEEVLDHAPDSVRMDWINSGRAPLLLDHDRDNQVGVVESARLENGAARAVVRFGKSAKAQEILDDVRDGIRSAVSVGYRIHEMLLVKESDDGDVYRATDWEPLEVSIVSIPADREVGVGRGDDEIETVIKGESVMTDKTNEAAAAAVDQRAADDRARREDKPRPAADQVRETDFSARNREVAEILAVAKRFDLHEKAAEFIADGKSLEAFNRYALDQLGQRNMNAARQKPAEIDMTRRERESYSLMRAIDAFVNKDWSKAGLEREMSDEIAKRVGKDPNGFFVPDNIGWPTRTMQGQRDLTVGSATAGGNLVGTDHMAGDFVEALRERLVLTQMGVRLIDGLVGDVDVPAANATTSTYHVAEGNAPTEGAPTFRQINMSPKTIAAYVDMSRKLRKQSAPSIEALIREDLMKSVAVGMQRVWINGGGTNEPTGILQTNGIGDVAIGTNGGAITWATVVDLEKEVEVDDAADGVVYYLTNAKVKASMKQTPKQGSGVEGNFIMPDSAEATLNGNPVRFTNGVPSDLTKGSLNTASALIFGDFSSLMVGMWGGLDLMPDPYTLSSSGGLRLTIFQDYDVAVRHAESFAACQDIDA